MNDGTIVFLTSLLKFCFSFLSDTRYFHVLNRVYYFLSILGGVTFHSLLVTRWKKLVAKSLITRCKKSLVTRCKIRLLLVEKVARCKKSLVTCCKICWLLAAEVTCCVAKVLRCKKSLVTRCKSRSLLIAEVARCKKSLDTHYRSCSLQKLTRCSLQNSIVTY